MERRGCGFRNSTTGSRAAGDPASAVGGEAKVSQVVETPAAVAVAGSSQASLGLEDPQHLAKVRPVMFHGRKVMAQSGAPTPAIKEAAALSWPKFSGDLLHFNRFRSQWWKVQNKNGDWLEDHQLCEVFKTCVPSPMAAHMAYFTSMEQIWDYVSVAVEKPLKVLMRSRIAMEEHTVVRDNSGINESLRQRYGLIPQTEDSMAELGPAIFYLPQVIVQVGQGPRERVMFPNWPQYKRNPGESLVTFLEMWSGIQKSYGAQLGEYRLLEIFRRSIPTSAAARTRDFTSLDQVFANLDKVFEKRPHLEQYRKLELPPDVEPPEEAVEDERAARPAVPVVLEMQQEVEAVEDDRAVRPTVPEVVVELLLELELPLEMELPLELELPLEPEQSLELEQPLVELPLELELPLV